MSLLSKIILYYLLQNLLRKPFFFSPVSTTTGQQVLLTAALSLGDGWLPLGLFWLCFCETCIKLLCDQNWRYSRTMIRRLLKDIPFNYHNDSPKLWGGWCRPCHQPVSLSFWWVGDLSGHIYFLDRDCAESNSNSCRHFVFIKPKVTSIG